MFDVLFVSVEKNRVLLKYDFTACFNQNLDDYVTKIGENSLDFHVEGSVWQKVKKTSEQHTHSFIGI